MDIGIPTGCQIHFLKSNFPFIKLTDVALIKNNAKIGSQIACELSSINRNEPITQERLRVSSSPRHNSNNKIVSYLSNDKANVFEVYYLAPHVGLRVSGVFL